MATHNFQIALRDDQPVNFAKVKAKIEEAGGTVSFKKDGSGGQFECTGVSGSFAFDGKIADISITKKPLLLPKGLIETIVRNAFAEN